MNSEIPVIHPRVELMRNVGNGREPAHARVLPNILVIRMLSAVQNAYLIRIVQRIEHALAINVVTHVLECVDLMLNVMSSITRPVVRVSKDTLVIHQWHAKNRQSN